LTRLRLGAGESEPTALTSRADNHKENTMEFIVELPEEQAWALALYLKRIGYAEYREKAAGEAEAWEMLAAGEALRAALAERGIGPR
jgi:hypothetical protein